MKNTLITSVWDNGLLQYVTEGNEKCNASGNLSIEDVTDIKFDSKGEMFAVSTAKGSVQLFAMDFIQLGEVYKSDEWIWSVSLSISNKLALSGTSEGVLRAHRVEFGRVDALHKNKYAYRDRLTSIVIHNIKTGISVRITYSDYVKSVAIHRKKLAVQIGAKIIIYTLADKAKMRYEMHKKISCSERCSCLMVTNNNLLLCYERRMMRVDFVGRQVEEWEFDADIRFAKIVGGAANRENIVVALHNGDVFKVFIGNSSPLLMLSTKVVVQTLDFSCDRDYLAIIDSSSHLFLYSLKEKKVIYEDKGVTSVVYNDRVNDFLAYSKQERVLAIKSGDLPIAMQETPGTLIAFKGSEVFMVKEKRVKGVDIALSGTVRKYVERKIFAKAYQVACLGVNKQDWRFLGFEAILNRQFEIAKKVFGRLKEVKYLELIAVVEEMSEGGEDAGTIQAEVLAHQGDYKAATQTLVKAGQHSRAVELYVELKMWKKADKVAAKAKETESSLAPVNAKDLVEVQADWAKRNGDYKSAAEIYKSAGLLKEAIKVYGEQEMIEELEEVYKKLNKQHDEELIKLCAEYFIKAENYELANEAYLRLGDMEGIIHISVILQQWKEGKLLARLNPHLQSVFYKPYGDHLMEREEYGKAQEAYRRAGRKDLGLEVLNALAENAAIERRFKDASYYYWKQALELLSTSDTSQAAKQHKKAKQLAHIYFAYNLIDTYVSYSFNVPEPNVNHTFNAACYLLNAIGSLEPPNVSLASIYYVVGMLGRQVGAFSTAQKALHTLRTMKVQAKWQGSISLEALKLQTGPFVDKEKISPICSRCMNPNPLLHFNDDRCLVCNHPFIRSFISFNTISLVEFKLADKISHEKAMDLIKTDHYTKRRRFLAK